MDADEVQVELLKIGFEFQRLDHWLYTLAAGLPRPAASSGHYSDPMNRVIPVMNICTARVVRITCI